MRPLCRDSQAANGRKLIRPPTRFLPWGVLPTQSTCMCVRVRGTLCDASNKSRPYRIGDQSAWRSALRRPPHCFTRPSSQNNDPYTLCLRQCIARVNALPGRQLGLSALQSQSSVATSPLLLLRVKLRLARFFWSTAWVWDFEIIRLALLWLR